MSAIANREVPSEILELPTHAPMVAFGRAPIGTPLSDIQCYLVEGAEASNGRDLVFTGLNVIAHFLRLNSHEVLRAAKGPHITYGSNRSAIKACKFEVGAEEWLFFCVSEEAASPKTIH